MSSIGDPVPDAKERHVLLGSANFDHVDNSIRSHKYTVFSFLFIATAEQFRRLGNVYFLIMSIVMYVGWYYPSVFESAITPWTTLGPLIIVVSFSLIQEGYTDFNRYLGDNETNRDCAMVLVTEDSGPTKNVMHTPPKKSWPMLIPQLSLNTASMGDGGNITLQKVQRRDIRPGHLVYIKNRDMIPADIVILASSNEEGGAYVETSSIDGETNLKARESAKLQQLLVSDLDGVESGKQVDTFDEAVQRIAGFSALTQNCGVSALVLDKGAGYNSQSKDDNNYLKRTLRRLSSSLSIEAQQSIEENNVTNQAYVATITCEQPNASVNTYSGKLTVAINSSLGSDGNGENNLVHCPLNAENLLVRGAILRNTEWAIGVAVFTGSDTKLVQNSFSTPSKFSQLDKLVNGVVWVTLAIMAVCVIVLTSALQTVDDDIVTRWYLGYSSNTTAKWPYLPDLPAPEWKTGTQNYIQDILLFFTLLNNFVPLSLYITMEVVTVFMMWFLNNDLDMYHKKTDTPARARSTTLTDLGQVEYIFSDKTGTLTQNMMAFKRCSVDGLLFGAPVNPSKKNGEDDATNQTKSKQESMQMNSPFHPLRKLLVGKVSFPKNTNEEGTTSTQSSGLTFNAEMFLRVLSICHTVVVEKNFDLQSNSLETGSHEEFGADGAPFGFAYQSESPDEGALVSAASRQFGFRLIGRDSKGVMLNCAKSSILEDQNAVDGLRNGTLTPKKLAAMSLSVTDDEIADKSSDDDYIPKDEVWSILAVNKFESDRKRMSVLVRSPPELGGVVFLFCKGADSSMLSSGVCEGNTVLAGPANYGTMTSVAGKNPSEEADNVEFASLAGIHAHLGDFATEGLRTLVLGIRILSDSEASEWLTKFHDASTTTFDRSKRLSEVACEIEQNIHVVGATGIEDKLQRGVPETISKLAAAGIKLWVLTGDKRQTAIEIGYSTKVLTPDMSLCEVAGDSANEVKIMIASEFMRLVKSGTLPLYQRQKLDQVENIQQLFFRRLRKAYGAKRKLTRLDKMKSVRDLAESILRDSRSSFDDGVEAGSPETSDGVDQDLPVVPPKVFDRATSAKSLLNDERFNLKLTQTSLRNLKLAVMNEGSPNNEEDVMSMQSFFPEDKNEGDNFDKKKRSILERLFAVDRDVRHGHLKKHAKVEVINTNSCLVSDDNEKKTTGLRAFVIEGSSLVHILGDPVLEEMVFAIASSCGAVIACRTTPRQKALLVKLVRRYVSPTPVTLAIGDGANDVGMIQEAHIGIGISGLEGRQAVNASDFSIAQFRFLEELLLVHGRYNFMRMSKVVLFSFYKNVLLAGTMIIFQWDALYSGQPVFDEWVIPMFNFVASWPIVFLGIFDMDLPKEYVLNNPQVYSPGPNNEYISNRMIYRWVIITFVHMLTLYFFGFPSLTESGSTYASGKKSNDIGNDESGNLLTVGLTLYTALILLLVLKVLFESRSIVNGSWPVYFNKSNEHWASRIPYTWFGTIILSIGLYVLFLVIYSILASAGFSEDYLLFAGVPTHMAEKSTCWIIIFFTSIAACTFDVVGKVFSNMYFPTQTQIHMEIAQKHKQNRGRSSPTHPVTTQDE